MRFRHIAAAGLLAALALTASGCAVAVYDDPWCGPYYGPDVVVYEPLPPPPPPVYYYPPPVVFVEPCPPPCRRPNHWH